MNPQSTDRTSIDSDQDKPRIILKDSVTITSSNVSTYAVAFVDLDLEQIKVDAEAMVELFVKDNQTGRVYKAPLITVNDSNLYDFNVYYYLQSNGVVVGDEVVNVQALSIVIYKLGGLATDTYTCYYVVYSTKINKDLDLTS